MYHAPKITQNKTSVSMSYFKAQVNYTLLPQTVTGFAGDLDNTAENKHIFGEIVSKVQQRKCTISNSMT